MRLQSKMLKHAQRNEMRTGIKNELPENGVRKVAVKIFVKSRSKNLYSFRNCENPKRSVVVTNRTRHVQPIKKNVSSVQEMVISVHNVSQKRSTAV